MFVIQIDVWVEREKYTSSPPKLIVIYSVVIFFFELVQRMFKIGDIENASYFSR